MLKKIVRSTLLVLFFVTNIGHYSLATPEGFSKGPVFKNYGENIPIKDGLNNPESQHFKIVFDVYTENETDAPHRGFNSIARFINMHVRAGVPFNNIDIALVIHGKASYDLMNDAAFKNKFEKQNPSSDLLQKLFHNNVKVFVCGQSSSFLGLTKDQFNKSVHMSLSAMTANALLQQQGYTLNPF